MVTIENILDNLQQYEDDINSLVLQLRACGINNLEELKKEARRIGVPIPKAMQLQIEEKFDDSDIVDWNKARTTDTIEAYQNYLDCHDNGKYRNAARERISTLQEEKEIDGKGDVIDSKDDIWEAVDKKNIDALRAFVQNYPENPHVMEANRLINKLIGGQKGMGIRALEQQIKAIRTNKSINNPTRAIYEKIKDYVDNQKITRTEILDALRKDKNFISSNVAYLLTEAGYLADFSSTGIEPDFIQKMLSNEPVVPFAPASPLEKVTKSPCTEIYFWGIPSSGKSCALGAILSAARSGKYARSMQMDNNCQGYGYMNRLSNLFKCNGQVGNLPEGTPTTSTYAMSFDLEDQNKKIHPLTCVDLAGELVRCMFKFDAGDPLLDQEFNVLQTLTNILIDNRTKNRKIHFFVIEYGAEDREYEGLPQEIYLDAALQYIKRTGIFKRDTDGLYLLITKVDKAGATGEALKEKLKEYINENYLGFYNGLKGICEYNEINGGEVKIIPFTLGEVCFRNYCRFKDTTAANVVYEIINRSYGYKVNKYNRMLDKFSK